MVKLTYYVALPFVRSADGELVPGEPKEAPTAERAKIVAFEMAMGSAEGAVAFSRTGDPSTGEFEPAIILAQYGQTLTGEIDSAP